jgi:DNA-binding beta-propeller fold protein YncE
MKTIDLFKDDIVEIPKHINEVFFLDVVNSVAVLSFNESEDLVCGWFLSPFDLVVLLDSPYIYQLVNVQKQILNTQQRFSNWFEKYKHCPCVLIGPDCDEAVAKKFNASYFSTIEGPVSIKVDTSKNIAYVIKEGQLVRDYKLF